MFTDLIFCSTQVFDKRRKPMANKSLNFCCVLVFLLIAIQTNPVALERQTVDEVVSVVNCFMFNTGSMQYSSIFLCFVKQVPTDFFLAWHS